MKNLYSRLRFGCVALVLVFASPAFGNPDEVASAPADYLVTSSTSAGGWTTVTLTPLKVECERILRSVTMDIYALGGTGLHRHDPARVTCDERKGHFSVRVNMDDGAGGGGAGNNAVERLLLAAYIPAHDGQTSHGPGDGHKDHQHVVYMFHDLE